MHQIVCRLGLCPRPDWGSLQRSPDPLAVFRGPISSGWEERGDVGQRRDRRDGREKSGGREEEGAP